jgi:hypothetical protein
MGQVDRRLDEAHASLSYSVRQVRVRVPHVEDVGETMKKIRIWLDHRKIQPVSFRTTGDARGYLLTIDFRTEETAEYFRQQFRTVDVAPNPSNGAIEPSKPLDANV